VGFGPTIPASERAKTVHALDRAATVTGKAVTPAICCRKVNTGMVCPAHISGTPKLTDWARSSFIPVVTITQSIVIFQIVVRRPLAVLGVPLDGPQYYTVHTPLYDI
jgi:hypothetical protein